eukprot:SAG22_NODE_11_length_35583_cov_107.128790_6_plen_263_part_00
MRRRAQHVLQCLSPEDAAGPAAEQAAPAAEAGGSNLRLANAPASDLLAHFERKLGGDGAFNPSCMHEPPHPPPASAAAAGCSAAGRGRGCVCVSRLPPCVSRLPARSHLPMSSCWPAGAAALSLVPSTPATPLVAGLKLFHPKDTAAWLARWAAERPLDGDPLSMLMAPAADNFKRFPLIIEPPPGGGGGIGGSGGSSSGGSVALAAFCSAHRTTLAEAANTCGSILFRGWLAAGREAEEVPAYERGMKALGAKTSGFLGCV